MKATTWLCPVLTLLCATRIVCTAQRGGYPLDYADTNLIQDDYLVHKRNKPSLSIVNPLDVLRQRLLLEIARRQMKENTRQVELNRAILKNVGKRVQDWKHMQRQEEELLQKQKTPHEYFPMELEYMPRPLIFDFVQRQRNARIGSYDPNKGYVEKLDDAKRPQEMDNSNINNNNKVATVYDLNGNDIANEKTTNMNNNNNNINNNNNGNPSQTTQTNHGMLSYNHGHQVNTIGIGNGQNDRSGHDIKIMDKNNNNGDDNAGNDDGNPYIEYGNASNASDNAKAYYLQYLYNLHPKHYARE